MADATHNHVLEHEIEDRVQNRLSSKIVERLIASNKNQKKDFKNKKSKFKNKKKCFLCDKERHFKKDYPSKSRFNEWNKYNADVVVAQEGYDNTKVFVVSEDDS